jgi:hypothetical protein
MLLWGVLFMKPETTCILQEDKLRAVPCIELGIYTSEVSHYES